MMKNLFKVLLVLVLIGSAVIFIKPYCLTFNSTVHFILANLSLVYLVKLIDHLYNQLKKGGKK